MGPTKHAKRREREERCGLRGPCHIARADIGRGSDALLRGMSKKRATAIFDLSLRVGPVSPKASGHVMLRSGRSLLCDITWPRSLGLTCFHRCRNHNCAANFGPPIIHPNLCFLCYLLFKISSFPFCERPKTQNSKPKLVVVVSLNCANANDLSSSVDQVKLSVLFVLVFEINRPVALLRTPGSARDLGQRVRILFVCLHGNGDRRLFRDSSRNVSVVSRFATNQKKKGKQ